MRLIIIKNVGKPTFLKCHFPTFYDYHLQLFPQINILNHQQALIDIVIQSGSADHLLRREQLVHLNSRRQRQLTIYD
jgi:hypothetical protein